MKIIVGLGNPGKEYVNTRHNIGFMFVDEVAKTNNLSFSLDKSKRAELATGTIKGEKVVLVKPITYMNLSGEALRLVMDYYKVGVEDIIVIHDDLDLPTGKLRIRANGSSGGHNGLKSIIANIKTQEFKRIKIGIDKKGAVIDYVLGKFSKMELDEISKVLFNASNIIDDYLSYSFINLMSKYN